MHEDDLQIYQIEVRGYLDPSWSEWFNGFQMISFQDLSGSSTTTLTGVIVDQSALRGILAKIWDLNLTVVSIYRIVDGTFNPDFNGG